MDNDDNLPKADPEGQGEPKKTKPTEPKEPSSRLKTQVEKIVKEVMKSWEDQEPNGTVKTVELPKPKPQPKQDPTLKEKLTEDQPPSKEPSKEPMFKKILKSIW